MQTELQAARHKAVSSQRPVRVRFNCPAAGEFRLVELIGSTSEPDPADIAGDRCSESRYPYPAADTNVLTRPNFDGPIRRLPREVAFVNQRTIEFWLDGTAHMDEGTNPWATIPPAGISITAANQQRDEHSSSAPAPRSRSWAIRRISTTASARPGCAFFPGATIGRLWALGSRL